MRLLIDWVDRCQVGGCGVYWLVEACCLNAIGWVPFGRCWWKIGGEDWACVVMLDLSWTFMVCQVCAFLWSCGFGGMLLLLLDIYSKFMCVLM